MSPEGQSSDATKAANIVSDGVQLFLSELQRYYDWTRDPDNEWAPDDVIDQLTTTAYEALPVIKSGVDLTLDLLRPWSKAFQARVDNA